MKTSLRYLIPAFAFFASLVFAHAGPPNLVGTWSGAYDLATSDGVKKSSATLEITKQEGPLLFATRTWKRTDGSLGHHQGQAVGGASDQLLGVIDFDNKSVIFVKSGKGPECQGLFRGRIANDNTLELLFIQAGEVARAGQVVLTREKK